MESIPENVTYFMECTGCERNVAVRYLSQSKSVEEAIDAYFTSPPTTSAPAPAPPTEESLPDYVFNDYEEDDYQPIIPQKRQKLVDQPEPHSSLLHAQLFTGAIAPLVAPPIAPSASLGGFNGSSMLSKAFQPPAQLLFHGSFDQVQHGNSTHFSP